MRYGTRNFTADTIEWLEKAVDCGAGRYALARGICEREGWTNPAGKPCLASARQALPALARNYGWSLPTGRSPPDARRQISAPAAAPNFAGSLDDLRPITLERADSLEDRRAIRALLDAHHPQGAPNNPGNQLMYRIRSAGGETIGALTFHAAGWHQKARDTAIGWPDTARSANLNRVINNSRFLICPGIEAQNLASHVLGLAARRVCDDWERVHGVRPVLAYTYCGPDKTGCCYACAGWRRVGETSGKPPGRRTPGPIRSVWIKPLADGWRDALCQMPGRPNWLTRARPALPPDGHWTDLEFGMSDMVDGRLRQRMQRIARVWENRPGTPVKALFPDKPGQRAAYRILANPKVGMDDILAGHRAATVQRCRDTTTVLAVQGTTALDVTNPRNGGTAARTITARFTAAISASGDSLGVLALSADQNIGTDRQVVPHNSGHMESLILAGQIGETAPDTRIVSVCDCRGGVWEMFATQANQPGAGLLVRFLVETSLPVRVDGRDRDLKSCLSARPVIGRHFVTARGGKGQPNRIVRVAIRAVRTALSPPDGVTETLPATALLATETDPPHQGADPVSWLLLSSEGECDITGYRAILDRYSVSRVAADDYIDALKRHTRIADPRLDGTDAQRRCLAFDAVIAWRSVTLRRSVWIAGGRKERFAEFCPSGRQPSAFAMPLPGDRPIRDPPFGNLRNPGVAYRQPIQDTENATGLSQR